MVGSPPAKCSKCGHVFRAPITITSSQVLFRGNTTTCPLCGGLAPIGDGVYAEQGGDFKLVAGPAASQAMVERLYGLTRRAKEEDLSAKEILAEVAEINPELAKKLSKKPLPAFILILVLFLFVRHFEVKADLKLDVNHLIDQAYHLAQQQDPEQHLSATDPVTPPTTTPDRQPQKESRQARRQKEREAKKHGPPA